MYVSFSNWSSDLIIQCDVNWFIDDNKVKREREYWICFTLLKFYARRTKVVKRVKKNFQVGKNKEENQRIW